MFLLRLDSVRGITLRKHQMLGSAREHDMGLPIFGELGERTYGDRGAWGARIWRSLCSPGHPVLLRAR